MGAINISKTALVDSIFQKDIEKSLNQIKAKIEELGG